MIAGPQPPGSTLATRPALPVIPDRVRSPTAFFDVAVLLRGAG